MSTQEIASTLNLSETQVSEALADLNQWNMVRKQANETWDGSGEPWDVLFAALEERRRREMQPALETLRLCHHEAVQDGTTPPAVRTRINQLLALVEDLAAIDLQSRRLSSNAVSRLVSFGGFAARLLNRAFTSPTNRKQK
ncbi:MAG: hypothetical protein V4525_02245 [Pseudomonadota bacterium]